MCSRCREPGRVARWRSAVLLLCLLAGCERETRRFRDAPPTVTAADAVRPNPLEVGPPVRQASATGGYEDNAWALSEGKRLFRQFNCTGCHAQGGGSIGPALMDAEWSYGSAPDNIYASIVGGRPNGMPAFGGKLGVTQVWQLVAYVRSLSGWIRKDVAPGRDDGMQVKAQEQATDEQTPRSSGTPASSERP
jgi:cytochrome c oxidase cbb3-type subunit III